MKKLSTTILIVLMTIAFSFGQTENKHKIPPMEVPSETKYEYKFINILGSQMAYIEEGKGDPILFLHGQPTSSYLWRNIMPHLENQGRVVAPDNIGFGKSDQPELDYTFGDHYKYIEAFIKAKNLKNITLVVHDWGSGLGLNYAPLIPAKSYDDMPKELGNFFRTVRDPETGKELLIKENFFIEGALPGFISRPLDPVAHDVYREPFLQESSRKQVNQWPNEMPIGKVPLETHNVVTAYNKFLEKMDIPWLFLYATPGALNPPEAPDYWAERAKNIEIVYIGAGLHYVQEDQPYAIGRAISDFYRRLEK